MQWTLHKNLIRKTDGHRHAVILVALGDKVYSLHYVNKSESDTQIVVRVLNTVSMRWTKLYPTTAATAAGPGTPGARGGDRSPPEVPSKRHGHSAVLIDGVIYVWGGLKVTGGCCNVLYAFDVEARRWSAPAVRGTAPQGKGYHSACVSEAPRRIMYVYGGCNVTPAQCNNDIHRLDAATMTWSVTWSLISTQGTPGPVLECHSATMIGARMYVFGGHGVRGARDNNNGGEDLQDNNVRVFDTETNCWLSAPPALRRPGGSRCHSAVAHGGELYVFGGHIPGQTPNDLWRFSPEAGSWRKVEPRGKGPRRLSKVVGCKVAADRVVLFGGNNRHRYASRARSDHMYVLDLRPRLKTLCKVAVIRLSLEQAELPHDLRWELGAMTATRKRRRRKMAAEATAPKRPCSPARGCLMSSAHKEVILANGGGDSQTPFPPDRATPCRR